MAVANIINIKASYKFINIINFISCYIKDTLSWDYKAANIDLVN